MAHVRAYLGEPQRAVPHYERALELRYNRFQKEKLEDDANIELRRVLRERDQTIEPSEQDAQIKQLELERTRSIGRSAIALAVLTALIAVFANRGYRLQHRITGFRQAALAEQRHRTKNALQIASSLTRQFERVEQTNGSDLSEIRHKLKTMALLHQHLRSVDDAIDVNACSVFGQTEEGTCWSIEGIPVTRSPSSKFN